MTTSRQLPSSRQVSNSQRQLSQLSTTRQSRLQSWHVWETQKKGGGGEEGDDVANLNDVLDPDEEEAEGSKIKTCLLFVYEGSKRKLRTRMSF
jgi:hypothetical protein